MPWADTIIEQFKLVNRLTTDESEYYGPFNTLLTHLFPHVEHYQVMPRVNRSIIPGSDDLTSVFIVRKQKYPMFFIEIKAFPHINEIYTRYKADEQMRYGYESLIGPDLIVPKLYGISAMGTRFSVYEYDKETGGLSPPSTPRDSSFVNDIAPASRWNYDLLEDEGERKMRELVREIKEMCKDVA